MTETRDKRKNWYDKNAVKLEFRVGELVSVLATSKPNKMAVQWTGPGVIESKLSETNYIVSMKGKKGKDQIYHINLLKPFHQRLERVNLLVNGGEGNQERETVELTIPYPVSDPNIYDFERIKADSALEGRLSPTEIESLKQLPLTQSVKGKIKKEGVNWTQDCNRAFTELKNWLTEIPVLHAPDYNREFIAQTDVSDLGIGVVLSQRNDKDEDHPVLFLSKKFTDAQRKYGTTEKECAEIIYAIKKLRYYLDGQQFTIETDHNTLVWLNSNAGTNQHLMTWSFALQPFRYKVVHKGGKKPLNTDTLSRSDIV
ncbi:Retrovirus-related Pol polyprotein from transposon 17.6 [Araneus ventricosus]|uniref:Retrovirus-related Pol polyprotein from transposon 17.6 n=1 Tax=Araneus ventricosus TaxID=182803 RepID=A0A4Y2PM01_ARAVE|nr:Retrovirus-related Pol polyprotein from transposon 17.6 [Araneus ventricosus]